jgi:hypothetical protein
MISFHKGNSRLNLLRKAFIYAIWLVLVIALIPSFAGCSRTATIETQVTNTQSPIYIITVTSPQNGDIWHVGDTVTITWTTTPNIPASATVWIFLENGEPMLGQQIGTTTNSGSFNWVVTNISTGNQMKIDIYIPDYSGRVSAGYFTISTQ